MSDDIWDDPDMNVNGNFWAPKSIGDKVSGTIRKIGRGKDFNGNPCPELVIDEQTVTAGQFDLKKKLADLRPKVGDQISIEFSSEEKVDKGTMKVFTVEVGAAKPVESVV